MRNFYPKIDIMILFVTLLSNLENEENIHINDITINFTPQRGTVAITRLDKPTRPVFLIKTTKNKLDFYRIDNQGMDQKYEVFTSTL